MTPLGFRVFQAWRDAFKHIPEKPQTLTEVLRHRDMKEAQFRMHQTLIHRARDAAWIMGLEGTPLVPAFSAVSIAVDSIEINERGGYADAVSKLGDNE